MGAFDMWMNMCIDRRVVFTFSSEKVEQSRCLFSLGGPAPFYEQHSSQIEGWDC